MMYTSYPGELTGKVRPPSDRRHSPYRVNSRHNQAFFPEEQNSVIGAERDLPQAFFAAGIHSNKPADFLASYDDRSQQCQHHSVTSKQPAKPHTGIAQEASAYKTPVNKKAAVIRTPASGHTSPLQAGGKASALVSIAAGVLLPAW